MRECWFCGGEVTDPWYNRLIGFHRGAETGMTRWVVVLRTTWQAEVVEVPRCTRCYGGHVAERVALTASGVALVAYAAFGQLDRLLGILPTTSAGRAWAVVWAVAACLPALCWLALRQGWLPGRRLAPRGLHYARHHPEVIRLREDGWRFRPGPFPYWMLPAGGHAPAPSTRFRRWVGAGSGLLGVGCFVTTIVLYFQDHEEVAGGFLAAAGVLLFLSSRVDPED
ncbi:hypothetical protein E0L36_04575 [Streptomyces sp. AJS327]|uniref:hypothetical protein n=1 Tax=Streptomyces sp. AJS327 TaxID=2545265 RepID=UPI0015DE20AD|nr:hypothetical protein [Streptomyces sp. AJS327]MBA0050198.1 hypothetical protein [Streptomyces sp. AJS327]